MFFLLQMVLLSMVFSLFLITSPFYYTIILILSSLVLIFYVIMFGMISSILAIIFLLVYVGAMMIMVGYVCSVNPGMKSQDFFSAPSILLLSLLFIFFSQFIFFIVGSYFGHPSEAFTPCMYLYSQTGILCFFFLGLLLLLLLLVVSHMVSIKSTIRSG